MGSWERAALYVEQSAAKRRLLSVIKNGHKSISDIARELDISSPSVHQHVEELKALGVVEKNRVGRYVYVTVTPFGQSLVGRQRRLRHD